MKTFKVCIFFKNYAALVKRWWSVSSCIEVKHIMFFLYLNHISIKTASVKMMERFIYIWSNYSRKNNHVEIIQVAVKNIKHLFCMASELFESGKLHLFLISDGTRIDNNEYLKSLENATELTVCTEEKMQKIANLFFHKKISYDVNINIFIW